MSYLGSWKIDDLLTFVCVTQVFATGVATDADSVPTYRVYEDETGTAILTGSMALLDSANTAGFYSEQITLSAANGFEKGKCYSIYIAATVSSVAGAKCDTFQMEAEVDANRLNWANVDNQSTAVNLSATNIDVDQVVASVSGAVGSVTGAVGSVTGAVGSVTGAVGSVTGSVGSVAAGGITAASIATGAVDADALATDAVAEIAAGVWQDAVAGDFTVASSIGKALYVANVVPGAAGGHFIAGTNAATVITTSLTTTFTGNLTGSVGSVTGAVGSVTGAVGSVTGSVGSVAAGGITATSIATDAIDADALATDAVTEIANGVWDQANGVETGLTPRQALRLQSAATAGKLSGAATTTNTIRNAVADSKNRIVATVDSDGNRTAITYDVT